VTAEAQAEPRAVARTAARSEQRGEPRRERAARPADVAGRADRQRGESERPNRAGARDEAVVGLGDDVPSFIAMSFDQRRTA